MLINIYDRITYLLAMLLYLLSYPIFAQEMVELSLYPTLECQVCQDIELAVADNHFNVQFYFADQQMHPNSNIKIQLGKFTEDFQLMMKLPKSEEKEWDVTAVIYAPNFVLGDQHDTKHFRLTPSGSFPVRFTLIPKIKNNLPATQGCIYLNFWHGDNFLGRIEQNLKVSNTVEAINEMCEILDQNNQEKYNILDGIQ